MLLLSVGSAGTAAGLVQIGPLPLARGDRSEGRPQRFRPQIAGRDPDPHLGFDGRDPFPGLADATRGHRELERGAARRTRDPRQHGRHRPAAIADKGWAMSNTIHDMGGMHGFGAVELEPNEPVFHEPWEGRVLAMQRAMGYTRLWTIDGGRASLEALPPVTYLTASYYQRWFLG